MHSLRQYQHGSPEWRASLARARANPVMRDVGYEGPWTLYDRLTAAVAATTATSLRFFQSPISATKTKNDTNLLSAGQLPHPERFKVLALRFIFAPNMHPGDIELFLSTYYAEFYVGQSIYAEGPMSLYPGGGGISTAATAYSNNGVPDPRAIYSLGDKGPEIGQGENFYVLCTGTAFTLQTAANGGTGQDILCVLDGIRVRAVS